MKPKIAQCQTAAPSPTVDAESFLAWTRDGLDRLITKLAYPYVDDSKPTLHLDELRAELWAKVAHILHSGRLAACPTRQKTLGYSKLALRNHLFSVIQKRVLSSESGPKGRNTHHEDPWPCTRAWTNPPTVD
jgi:hypothetical protein